MLKLTEYLYELNFKAAKLLVSKIVTFKKCFLYKYFFSACHLLGDYMEAIKGDFAKAYKVYKTNCKYENIFDNILYIKIA